MKSNKFFRAAAVAITSAGLILPQSQLLAAAPQDSQTTRPVAKSLTPSVMDVTLTDGGMLRGQIVDAQGQPVADAPVSVLFEGKEVVSTKTVADGSFAVNGLRNGTHVVASGENGGVYRMWSSDSAPPAARPGIMIVRGGRIARGQGFTSRAGLLMVAGLAGIVIAGTVSQGNDHRSGS